MKILWVTNVSLPEASFSLKEKPTPFGGWLVNTSKVISEQKNIELHVAFPHKKEKEIKKLKGTNINYHLFPLIDLKNKDSKKSKENISNLLRDIQPDIVHIFGTEYAHSLVFVKECIRLNIKSIVTIQGLISVISKHYMANLPHYVQKRFTLRDLLKRDNIYIQQKKFEERGELEKETIKLAENIIGRTTWDRACTLQINPKANYYHCNETLRDSFYYDKWDINDCEKHTLFLSQGSYPIKGLHYILEAMPLILEEFPDTKLYVAGQDITRSGSLVDKLKLSSYGKYIKSLISKYNLKGRIAFTGLLDEDQMRKRYLKTNVFVSPSVIENSPNSLAEAMILGVPTVTSHVGGVPDMFSHNEHGFTYQSDAPYMLAYYICELFRNKEKAVRYSNKSFEHAHETHNPSSNLKKLLEIYHKIDL